MRKFLIITHAFPPFGGGGVQRMVKFATYLKREGWEATVVCPNHKNDSWLDFERMKEVSDIHTIRIGYRNIKNDPFVIKAFRKIYPVDSYLGWAFKVIRTLSKKDLSIYDIIFTSSPPSTTHLIGYILSRKANIKWVADFRDHYTLGPEYNAKWLKKNLDKKFERKIYQKSSAIILNTETNKNEILSKIKTADPMKMHVIYNGFDYQDLQQTDATLYWQQDSLTHYLYLGGLRGDKIDGAFYMTLAEALEQQPTLRDELKIHVIGDHSRKGNLIETLQISKYIDFLDPVPYNRVADYLANADGCITWQRSEPKYRGTIAGKFFDYIGMKKPVFSLGQDDGEIATILKKYRIGISANPENIKEAGKKFVEFHEKVKNNSFDYSNVSSPILNKFNRVGQSKQLATIFHSII